MAYIDYSKVMKDRPVTINNALVFTIGEDEVREEVKETMNIKTPRNKAKNDALIVQYLGRVPNDQLALTSGYTITSVTRMATHKATFQQMSKSDREASRIALEDLVSKLKGISSKLHY